MRRKFSIESLLTLCIASFLLVSCSEDNSVSSTTGWKHNDPENGNFNVVDYKEPKIGPGLVDIEGGTFTMGSTVENVFYDWNNNPRRVTVASFYIDQTEVTNLDYLEYIHWLTRVYGDEYSEYITNALPDTTVWRSSLSYNEPMVEIYFRHPAYRDYPVVGVSWLQANDYALWRSDRVNEKLLIDAGVLEYNNNQTKDYHFSTDAYLAGKYTGVISNSSSTSDSTDATMAVVETGNAQMEDGIILPQYRLPTEAEWEFAALGLIGNTYDERVAERRVYPWNSDGLRTTNQEYFGYFVANFKRGRGDYMGVAGFANDGAAFPTKVLAYYPNDYGLFNMAGNVSEWVLDVYRPLSFDDVDDYNPYRGDRYAGGRSNITDSTNYDYNLNYRDGDYMTSINSSDWSNATTTNPVEYTANMYNSETTLISDRSRVYKGGSWADGPYYLSPSVRRFMNEDESSSTVGFRCAMNHIQSNIFE